MKRALLVLLLVVFSFTLVAQKQKTEIKFTAEGLPGQLKEYLITGKVPDKEAEYANVLKSFETVYSSLDQAAKGRFADVCSLLVKGKAKKGDMSDFLSQAAAFMQNPVGKQNMSGWLDCADNLMEKSKSGKKLFEFAEFTEQLAKDRTLNSTQSALWQAQAGCSFALRWNDDEVQVVFDKNMELYYGSRNDNGVIYGTTGVFHFPSNTWTGKGGRLTWERTGLPASSCWASLGNYKANTKYAKFTADSVKFTNSSYFKSPIMGRVEESMSTKMEPAKYGFPKFRSYQRDFKIKDIVPGVDYQGCFMMNGGKMVTNDSENPGTLVFYRNSKPFILVQAAKFNITHSKLVSEQAAVVIRLGKDSITNDGVAITYQTTDRTLNIVNMPQRNFYSPYNDSYHSLDIFCENISYKLDDDKLILSSVGTPGDESFCTFESCNYFSDVKARNLQGLGEISPAMLVYKYTKKRGFLGEFFIEDFAHDTHFDLAQSKKLIHELAHYGLVSFNEATGNVTAKPKLKDYVKSETRTPNHDYDAITLESATKGVNAVLSLESLDLNIEGISKFVVSDSQAVAIRPYKGKIVVHKNRDISFSGRVDAGRFVMFVTDADFSYEKFNLDMPKVDSMFFYVKMFTDPNKEQLVRTPLHQLVATIQIDEPDNHNGLKRTKDFPILESKENSFVYYDAPVVQHGLYRRDKFYFTLYPFTVKNLVNFATDSVQFGGKLTSAGIFPDFEEPLKVQPDYSLGFVRQTPKEGFPAYGGKGTYHNTIDLSYKGLRGRGQVDYLTSVSKSNDILFLPDSMFAITDTFYVREEGGFPDIQNGRTFERWYPYMDSMNIAQPKGGTPFIMYHGATYLDGYVALRPEGAIASGDAHLNNDEGLLSSLRFDLSTTEMDAQVSKFVLQSKLYNKVAFQADNMQAHVDFKARRADFVANDPISETKLPVLQYKAFVDKFSWGMDNQTLDLQNSKSNDSQGLESVDVVDRVGKEMPGARFVSMHPKQDNLEFNSVHAIFKYDHAELSCQQVFLVNVADAAIAPSGDSLHISRNADMKLLQKSKIVASRDNKFHQFYDADVIVTGRNAYSGKGYIDYIDEDEKHQPIFMESIAPNKEGVTIGQGFIADDANFTLNKALGFAGKVRVEADTNAYFMEGGVRLIHNCLPADKMGLLAFNGYIDPKDVQVEVPEIPVDWKGERITAAILYDPNSLEPRNAFLTSERAVDNEIVTSFGYLEYDSKEQVYRIASREKLEDLAIVGRLLTLNTQTCAVSGEGPVRLGIRQGVGGNFAYGNAKLDPKDIEGTAVNTLFGVTFPMQDKVIEYMAQLIADDLRLSPSNPDNDLLHDAMVYYMGDEKGNEAYTDYVSTGAMNKKPKQFDQTLLFGRINWKYSSTLGYYYDGVTPLMMVGKKQLNLDTRVKAQIFKRGTTTNLTLYIQVASDHWYYFNYEANTQQLTIYSSVGEWVDMIKGLSADQRQVSDKTGTFHYRVGSSKNDVANFLLRFGQTDGSSATDSEDGEEDSEEEDD